MDGALQSKIAGEIGRYKDPDFIDTLKKWLDISWTHRLTSSLDTKGVAWSAEKWLDSAYSSAANKDIPALTELIHKASIPEEIDGALISINSNAWASMITREVNAHRLIEEENIRKLADENTNRQNARKLSEEKRRKYLKRAWIFSAAALVFCGVLALVAFLNRENIGLLINGTYTPTATLTPTATPTFVPTPTLPSTPTLMPTPLTPSIYLVPDPKAIYPVVSNAVESAWIIPPESVTVEPAISDTTTWRKETSTDTEAKNEVFYSTQKAALLFWTTDQPLPGGWYAIYVLDTKSKSGGYGPQTYTISSNGQSLLPFRGQSSAFFNVEELGQKSDEWLALGMYEIQAGQKIEVKTVVPPLTGIARFGLNEIVNRENYRSSKSLI
ncbi:hypothetical protein [Candidatus Villigracilis affinis]|uniref:hypothetical protein n=1 Tax=Candidatus Villigracilis affinis TaxID=3140682 RepID=UPI002A200E6F|nr:hypothetical protein [Anaerolineales bacterium]